MPDFSDHADVLIKLQTAQGADHDNREMARESHDFIDEPDGQWEDNVLGGHDSRKPRFTFDMTEPIINQISGELKKSDFDIQIRPAGGEASKDDAATLDGLIRNIENISNATTIFNQAGKKVITAGIDGWQVVQRFVDHNSFDQDLIIEPIPDFLNSVWFDANAKRQDKADAGHGFVLEGLTQEVYDEEHPEGSGISVGDDRTRTLRHDQKDEVIIGQIYYIKEEDRKLFLMTDGSVLEDNEDFEKIRDELAEQGITVKQERNRPKRVVFSRLFDGGDWLNEEQRTVFSWIPIIPTYGNYKITERQQLYRGVTRKLMDSQRVFNYSMSRQIAEGALAPIAKFWMTLKQTLGFEDTLATLNTNHDPVQLYNPDPTAPGPPMQTGGAQINPGLSQTTASMSDMMNRTAGMFAANMGDNPGLQSGVAIKRLQDKGDTGTVDWFESQEIAICHTARILIDAIPKVYDTEREVRILAEDGSFSMMTLNEMVFDDESGEMVRKNDLSKGTYDVVCSSGPSFQSKQDEAQAGILEYAAVDPTIIELGRDILLNNTTTPGMDKIAERAREQMFRNGLIPQSQWTEDEKAIAEAQAAQAAQEPEGPSPEEMIGQAEIIKAQNEQAKTQISVQEKSANIQLAGQKHQLDVAKFQQGAADDAEKLDQSEGKQQFEQFIAMQKLGMEQQQLQMQQVTAAINDLNTQVQTMQGIREASGVDVITGPGIADNFITQSDIVTDTQEDIT